MVTHAGFGRLGAAALMTSAIVAATTALADKDEPALRRIQLDGRLALGKGLNSAGLLAQIGGAYRVLPSLFVGGYVQHPLPWSQLDADGCSTDSCAANYTAIGPRAELQSPPEWVLGPWAGMGLGLTVVHGFDVDKFDYVTLVIPEATVDVGLELRTSAAFAFGPYMLGEWFLTRAARHFQTRIEWPGGIGVFSWGLRIAVRF